MSRISKSLRAEILRRDGYICRYCGRRSPDVELQIDHVHPVALGGTNEPSNLQTLCTDCNSGKAATVPDAPTVEAVNLSASDYEAAYDAVLERRREANADIDRFRWEWDRWGTPDSNGMMDPIPMSYDWPQSVRNWLARRLSIEDIVGLIPGAMKPGVNDPWPYFCKIVWNTIKEIEGEVEVALAAERSNAPDPEPLTAVFFPGVVMPADLLDELHEQHAERLGES